ncbi:DUF7555 family protein [Halorubrum lipolyticum]|uniref:Uncharacterized protein n=1 Tax=Halorubrum lipolyticum DSM 21995 TaxID=1227482 RepID=M0NSV1_9EURY|nr:hypothetical protein [Halorubrum lipolyticum]EMA60658.1 hypothetical protein C469_08378 [Halorubrum lipolyticum DSM 21995]
MGAARDRLATLARAWADAAAYAVALAALVTGVALAVGIATGGGFVRGKALTFVGGWLLVGYGTVRLWPSSIEDLSGPPISARGTRLEGIVRRLPPLRWVRLPAPTDRIGVAGKVFLAGVIVLGVSFLLETGFGVR